MKITKRVAHRRALDIDTTGLLLITDDGQFSQADVPKHKVEKTYRANFGRTSRCRRKIPIGTKAFIGRRRQTHPARTINSSSATDKIVFVKAATIR